MNKTKTSISSEKMNDVIIEAIQDVKGKDIVKLDMRKVELAPADYFIVCSGDSSTQVKSIANKIYKKLKEEYGIVPNHTEGKDQSTWVLVDYFNTVVHVFHPEAREFYELEGLWSDAAFTEYENN